MTDFWQYFRSEIGVLLGQEDDLAFWKCAIDHILVDTHTMAEAYPGKYSVLVEVGRCSHWIRPHTKRPSGMAWPYGYGNAGQGFSLKSLPQFDWSLRWMRQPNSGEWVATRRPTSRRPLVQRITIPARTAQHPRGTVHSIWLPGSPESPAHKLAWAYGFAKIESGWQCIDHCQLGYGRRTSRST
jgi:hypothetical protein